MEEEEAITKIWKTMSESLNAVGGDMTKLILYNDATRERLTIILEADVGEFEDTDYRDMSLNFSNAEADK